MTTIKRLVLAAVLAAGAFAIGTPAAGADEWCATVGLRPGSNGQYELPVQPPAPLWTRQCVPAP